MFKNIIKISWRNLIRHKGYTFINIIGLSIGIATFVIISLFVRDEFGFDGFHTNADHIYRVNAQIKFGDRTFSTVEIPGLLSSELVNSIPAVLEAVRMTPGANKTPVQSGSNQFFEDRIMWSESSLFTVFDFNLIKGNAETALDRPHTLVVSSSTAHRYFGEMDPLAKIVHLDGEDEGYEITGIFEDVPHDSHLQFDLVVSIVTGDASSWQEDRYMTYVLLADEMERAEIENIMNDLSPNFAQMEAAYELQPLLDIYLSGSPYSNAPAGQLRGKSAYVYLFLTIAICVLILACVNYANLTTAQSAQRLKEIGIRKTVGARRVQLAIQFLGESLLFCFGVGVIAIGLIEMALPTFNALVGKELAASYFGQESLLPFLLGIILIVGILSGGYPALVLAMMPPVSVIKGTSPAGRTLYFRKSLVVFQFVTFITLTIAVISVHKQLKFVQNKGLGFDKEHLILLKTEGALTRNQVAFIETISHHPNVMSAAYGQIPGISWVSLAYPEGFSQEGNGIRTFIAAVDYNFVTTLGMNIVAGRNLSAEYAQDARQSVLLNETAVNAFGWSRNGAIDKTLRLANTEYTVVGVVRDYHFQSLKNRIQPLMMHSESYNMYRNLAVRVRPGDMISTVAFLEETWQQFIPGKPFSYAFLDEEVDSFYKAELIWKKVLTYASFLVVVIACLGLLGLAAFSAQRRTKEIGIRKVLGATVPGLVALLTKEFLLLVGAAFLVAAPIAYFSLNFWLTDFAYRIELSVEIFLLGGLLGALIAMATVSYQAVRAALSNPVKSLRYE